MKILTLFLSFSLMVFPYASAAYKMGTSGPVKVKKRKAAATQAAFPSKHEVNPEIQTLEDLSKHFSVPVERLSYYRSLHYGYEELVPSLVISREAQVEIGRVLKMRTQGKNWQQITEFFSVDPGTVSGEAESILAPLRSSLPKSALSERPRTRG